MLVLQTISFDLFFFWFKIELTDEQKALYPEIAELREKIERLQADEYNIRSQLYYGAGGVTNTGTGGAAYDGVTGDTATYTF